jgi:chromosome segregation ATPase
MLYFYREEIRKDRMPTLEERLEALERALSTIRAEQISDIRQLDERISALHQQVAEQRRRLSERDQDLQQKFDSLATVLTQQFSAIHQHFGAINARFDAQDQHFGAINARFDAQDTSLHQHFTSIDAQFSRLDQRIGQQTGDIKQKFETSDLYATRTWGVVQEQERDIQAIKGHLDTMDGKIDQILERLPRPGE